MSLFNPWVLLGILMAVIGAGTTGYIKGGSDESKRQQLEIARLNEQARAKEQALVSAVQTQATQLVKANNNAKTVIQKRNADIDSGTLRLRLPVIAFKQEPNLSERLLKLLSPSQTMETKQSDNSTPASMPTTPFTKP